MRPLPLAVLVLLAAPALAHAAGEEIVRLEVGESRAGVGTFMPLCDAPSVATISNGILRAVGVGETICSAATVQSVGLRRIYRVIVTRPAPKGAPAARDAGEKGGAGTGGAPQH